MSEEEAIALSQALEPALLAGLGADGTSVVPIPTAPAVGGVWARAAAGDGERARLIALALQRSKEQLKAFGVAEDSLVPTPHVVARTDRPESVGRTAPDAAERARERRTALAEGRWSIADAIAADVALLPKPQRFVVNCASAEYWRAAAQRRLEDVHGVRVIACVFPGPAVHAKAARGAMCRHVVTARVMDPEGLKTFAGANGEWAFERVERENGPNGGERFVFARAPTTTTTKRKQEEKKKTAFARTRESGKGVPKPKTSKRAKRT